MQLHVGTSGFQYDQWKGSFYPEDIKKPEMLGYYAHKLGAVEINNTFYRMPRASTLQSWAEQVPESFKFVLKVSRKITHFKRLQEIDEELGYLLKTVPAMGDRLGPLLFQLPPKCPKHIDRLAAALRQLPATIRAAFEFRDPRWLEDDVFKLLRDHDCGLCVSDTDEAPIEQLTSTATWGYVRLRAENYTEDQLALWISRLHEPDWTEAYVFFKHEEQGPDLATRLNQMG